ncbi:MAG TPA: hypothetical protein VFF65_01755 [Phycisphaerales bacterium]|nr:hypothetical protein [Phycisphaerales bacterium]
MLPASDGESIKAGGGRRQVELFRPSGENHFELRICDLDDEHSGQGYSVRFDKTTARDFLEGVERALGYFGWDR